MTCIYDNVIMHYGLPISMSIEDLWRLVCLRYVSVESEDLLAMLFL